MDTDEPIVVPLRSASRYDSELIGSKALNIGRAMAAGLKVPSGFCVTTVAYRRFLEHAGLGPVIKMELGRKPLQGMRWEELWDAALRIRSAFLSAPVPVDLCNNIARAVAKLGPEKSFAVRSSAPGEDSKAGSFAGLHESQIGVIGLSGILETLPMIWASLWSDAALLYRRELHLEPTRSRMAILVQELVDDSPSGVAFARDPRFHRAETALVEAVPGRCADLVDGLVEPDRWTVDTSTGEIREWLPGVREAETDLRAPLLDEAELKQVIDTLAELEKLLDWPPDMEWTGRRAELTVLQARPITTLASKGGEERTWYLTLRPARRRLARLCHRVGEELIPKLEALGRELATQLLEDYDDHALAAAIDQRCAVVAEWKRIYRDDFIPFAHGIRQLGIFYNDAVKPDDPYEFVELLAEEQMLATRRNEALGKLATAVNKDADLKMALVSALQCVSRDADFRSNLESELEKTCAGDAFLRAFDNVIENYMDVTYGDARISERPELVLSTVLEMSRKSALSHSTDDGARSRRALEHRLFDAVGVRRRDEAEEILRIGRVSWRLRDDDNLLVGRLDSQLMRALELARSRLRSSNRLLGDRAVVPDDASTLVDALRQVTSEAALCELPAVIQQVDCMTGDAGMPRQLVGQPASPGLASGCARRVCVAADLAKFRAGEVLICDAIQPNMTQLVPLASAVVERRGGMLIHGAIIARELGIPCVNGVRDGIDRVRNGQVVSVDGNLGVVTIGPPDFDIEFRPATDLSGG